MTRAFKIERSIIARGRAEAVEKQAHCCKYCFEPFSVSPATAEHRVPRSKGGSNLPHNIDAACSRCNSLKGSLTSGQFLKMIKRVDGITEMEHMMAYSRRRIWLTAHRACRNIGRSVGMLVDGPLGGNFSIEQDK